jgi:hypothetical protein
MKKTDKKSYVNQIFVKGGKFYKVFEVDLNTEMISARNLEKDEIIIRETFDKWDKNYKMIGGKL